MIAIARAIFLRWPDDWLLSERRTFKGQQFRGTEVSWYFGTTLVKQAILRENRALGTSLRGDIKSRLITPLSWNTIKKRLTIRLDFIF